MKDQLLSRTLLTFMSDAFRLADLTPDQLIQLAQAHALMEIAESLRDMKAEKGVFE